MPESDNQDRPLEIPEGTVTYAPNGQPETVGPMQFGGQDEPGPDYNRRVPEAGEEITHPEETSERLHSQAPIIGSALAKELKDGKRFDQETHDPWAERRGSVGLGSLVENEPTGGPDEPDGPTGESDSSTHIPVTDESEDSRVQNREEAHALALADDARIRAAEAKKRNDEYETQGWARSSFGDGIIEEAEHTARHWEREAKRTHDADDGQRAVGTSFMEGLTDQEPTGGPDEPDGPTNDAESSAEISADAAGKLIANLEQSSIASKSDLEELLKKQGERLAKKAEEDGSAIEESERRKRFEETKHWQRVREQILERIIAVLDGKMGEKYGSGVVAPILKIDEGFKGQGFLGLRERKAITAVVVEKQKERNLEISEDHARQAREEAYALLGIIPPQDEQFDFLKGEFEPGWPSRNRTSGASYRKAQVISESPTMPGMHLIEWRTGGRRPTMEDMRVEPEAFYGAASHWQNSEFEVSNILIAIRAPIPEDQT